MMQQAHNFQPEYSFWDALEIDQIRHWMKLSFREKILWLEGAENMVRRFHPDAKGPLSSHTLLIRSRHDVK